MKTSNIVLRPDHIYRVHGLFSSKTNYGLAMTLSTPASRNI